MEILLKLLSEKGFLGEAINSTFIASEVSILVAYLVITSIYQVVIQTLSNSNSELKIRISLLTANKSLKKLRLISIGTACSIMISTLASWTKLLIADCASLGGFIFVILYFTLLIVSIINSLFTEP